MRLIAINETLLSCFRQVDGEVLQKAGRPVVLVVKMKYRGKKRDFAVPLRSNIPPTAPPDQYYALPNRPETRPKHHHGIHLIKMFPVDKRFYVRYRTDTSVEASRILDFINKREDKIVAMCQKYLERIESGDRPQFSTDIDRLLEVLDQMHP